MRRTIWTLGALLLGTSLTGFAKINQVRVLNHTDKPVYIHLGAYAGSQQIKPGKWKIFHYPFKIKPPNSTREISTSLIAASIGGQWITSPNGITTLKDPTTLLCLDYNTPDLRKKTGNRKWEIKLSGGIDKGCKIKPYKQPWATS